MRNTADVTGGKPIAVLLQSISGVSAINLYSPFTTSMEERERCYSFILSRTPHETMLSIVLNNKDVILQAKFGTRSKTVWLWHNWFWICGKSLNAGRHRCLDNFYEAIFAVEIMEQNFRCMLKRWENNYDLGPHESNNLELLIIIRILVLTKIIMAYDLFNYSCNQILIHLI
jgi:hypothetical protein